MNVSIQIVEPGSHRPGITGCDWTFDEKGDLTVKVSRMSDWRREMLLATHETVEAIMCRANGVTQKMVDDFDIPYAQTHEEDLDAGDEPDAPYQHEHCIATAIERVMCAEFRINWNEYDREVAKLQ